jgi:hypothetical protein
VPEPAPEPAPVPEPEPAPEPTINLTASESTVPAGGAVTLSWTAAHADRCEANGGWSGGKSLAGSEVVAGLTEQTTFSLTCAGSGGSAVVMTSVSALGEITVNWVAPSENVDGTPLVDLHSYRIHYGAASRTYSETVEVTDPASTSHSFSAPSGDYFITMTSRDRDGNESVYANEILRSVP